MDPRVKKLGMASEYGAQPPPADWQPVVINGATCVLGHYGLFRDATGANIGKWSIRRFNFKARRVDTIRTYEDASDAAAGWNLLIAGASERRVREAIHA